MAVESQGTEPEAPYPHRCHTCETSTQVDGAAETYDCRCGQHHLFLRCPRCDGINSVAGTRGQREPIAWYCLWCLVHHKNVGLAKRRRRTATAAEAWQNLERHGLIDCGPGVRVLGGFQLIGGHGDCPPLKTLCSVVCLADAVLIVAEVGATGSVRLPYTDLLAIEASGRGIVTHERPASTSTITGRMNGQAFNGTIGPGILETLRNLDTPRHRTEIDSLLRISTPATELNLRHWALPPEDVRDVLSRAFVGHRNAERARTTPRPAPQVPAEPPPPASPLDELERLTKLHAAGTLTDTEFERARATQINRLHNTGG
jgi:hypothetical protein